MLKYLRVVLVLVVLAAVTAVGIPMVASKYTWVAVAQVNLSAGTRIGEGLAWLKVWPVATVPSGATHTLEDIFGKYLLSNKTAGDIISPSDVTDIKPKPHTPKRGYDLFGFHVSREDAASLQVGDVVDVTIKVRDRPPITSLEDGVVAITFREDWVVAIIDYEHPLARSFGFVEVSLEMKNIRILLNKGMISPTGMVRRAPVGK